MSIAPTKRLTAADLLRMPDGDRFELVDGELLETTMSAKSSWIAGEIVRRVGNFLETQLIGRVYPEGTTYQCFPEEPERVRKPDASFVRAGRMPPDQFEAGHIRFAPDLAIEVVSPNDNHRDLMQKLEDYFSAGVPLVWVFEPELRSVTIYEQGGETIRRFRETDELTGGNVLPGFRCPVNAFFPPVDSARK